jgi:hypothetical protein
MILKYFRQKMRKMALLAQTTASTYLQKLAQNIFFRRKSAKIAENCDHNIDPGIPTYDENFDIFENVENFPFIPHLKWPAA